MSLSRYKKFRSRGDTLVEVMFAIAIFSLVAVGSLSIMNQGTATAERSLEITLVREQIDAQAETLRFLNASYIVSPTSQYGAQWVSIQNSIPPGKTEVSAFGGGTTCPASPPSGSFILNPKNSNFVSLDGSNKYEQALSYSQIRYEDSGDGVKNADGIWIEALRVSNSSQSNADYIDFHINACWDSPGQSAPMTTGTIVRLYEPV
jgi:prepilin-type N-terminal cleavage/methylation domain-containing protein